MSEEQTNKTTGGVWVPCSERLPNRKHINQLHQIMVRDLSDNCGYIYYKHIGTTHTHWLDTTVEIVTREEHEAAIATLQKENEELRARIEELKSLARAVTVVDFELVTCKDVGEEYWFDARARLLKGGTDGD